MTSPDTAAPSDATPLPVLVVDDDNQLLRTLADILRRRGYDPRTASSGREGLRAAASSPPPAIALVDLKLPDMDGMELVARLRDVSQSTEVVVLTGNASLESAVGALRARSYDYLVKPVAPDDLLATLGRASDRWLRHRAEDAVRRGEERFRALVESIRDVVFVLDAELEVEYASPAAERVLGVAADELRGRRIVELLLPAGSDGAHAVAEALRARDPARLLDVRARHANGSWRVLQIAAAKFGGEPGEPATVLTARDVTEQRRIERQAQQAHRLDSIGHLAGGIAHDFNNILSLILGSCELALLEDGVPVAAAKRIDEAMAAGKRAATLTRQLLQFASRQASEPKTFSVRDRVRDLAPLLRRLLDERIELVLEVGDDPCFVRADPAQLEQVILNLVVNARDAMPSGGRLAIAARGTELDDAAARAAGVAAGEFVAVSVQDTGAGMDEETRARAFEPFFTTKEPGTGTGLGLSICYGIVKQAGGVLRLESAPGQGTRVEALLPRAAAGAADEEPAETRVLPGGDETILVVEDDASVRGVTVAMLERLGYAVVTAAGADEALAAARSNPAPIDLVVTDVVMPKTSGPELVRTLRAERPSAKALFVSGYPQMPGGRGASALAPVLAKPFTTEALAHAVRKALDA